LNSVGAGLLALPLCCASQPNTGIVQPDTDIVSQLHAAAENATLIYLRKSVPGLQAQSEACYRTHGSTFPCVNFDIAAEYLVRTRTDGRNEYFRNDAFLDRAAPLAHRVWDMQTANAYLQFADHAVGETIEAISRQVAHPQAQGDAGSSR
jgi:hypothetical protein